MIKDIINKLFNHKNKIDDVYYEEFSNLVSTAKATRNIVSDINVMLSQIMNHEPINTKWEKLNSLTFKDVGDLSLFISVMCASVHEELSRAKARVSGISNTHTMSSAESSMYALCDSVVSSLILISTFSLKVNKHPEDWTFDSIESFANTIFHMNQQMIDYFDMELKNITG